MPSPEKLPPKQEAAEDTGNKRRKGVNNYAKYSGMAIQMGLIMLAGVYGGRYLDGWLGTTPYLLVLSSLVSVFLALYIPLKDL